LEQGLHPQQHRHSRNFIPTAKKRSIVDPLQRV
jgi:hypothetical protein